MVDLHYKHRTHLDKTMSQTAWNDPDHPFRGDPLAELAAFASSRRVADLVQERPDGGHPERIEDSDEGRAPIFAAEQTLSSSALATQDGSASERRLLGAVALGAAAIFGAGIFGYDAFGGTGPDKNAAPVFSASMHSPKPPIEGRRALEGGGAARNEESAGGKGDRQHAEQTVPSPALPMTPAQPPDPTPADGPAQAAADTPASAAAPVSIAPAEEPLIRAQDAEIAPTIRAQQVQEPAAPQAAQPSRPASVPPSEVSRGEARPAAAPERKRLAQATAAPRASEPKAAAPKAAAKPPVKKAERPAAPRPEGPAPSRRPAAVEAAASTAVPPPPPAPEVRPPETRTGQITKWFEDTQAEMRRKWEGLVNRPAF